jgi:acyl-CoA thioesterase
MNFDEVTDWPDHEGVRQLRVPEEWKQGRTTYGGVLAAAALRAMSGLSGGRQARTISVQFLGPVRDEPAQLVARALRTGRSLTFADAVVSQGDEPCATFQAVFGDDRGSDINVPLEKVDVPDNPDAYVDLPYIEGVIPQHVRNFQLRWTDGGPPFSGTQSTVLAGFVRFRDPPARGPERILGLLDSWPAPVLQQLTRHAPASSVTWTAHFVRPDDVPAGDWCWFRSDAVSGGDGFATMVGRLYGPDGRLLAWLEQLVAIFG